MLTTQCHLRPELAFMPKHKEPLDVWLYTRLLPLQGIIINGCIRDSEDISKMPLGVKALNTYPLKSSKRDNGLSEVPVTIGGTIVKPGDWIYADRDGVLVSSTELTGK